jgi:thiol-disulfide isomerase/thioredoxin
MKRIKILVVSLSVVLAATSMLAFASNLAEGSTTFGAVNKKVTVAVIKAEWCSACQKVEPIMMDLMKEYGDRINFVVLDVTNEETTAKAAATAKANRLSSFFEANKKNTSTVGVFKSGKQTFLTAKNYNRSDYVNAFERALK